jgi:hypothetical protein
MVTKTSMIMTVVLLGIGWATLWFVEPPFATIVQGMMVLGSVVLLAAWMVWFFGWRQKRRRPHRLIA